MRVTFHSWHIFTPLLDIDLLGFSRDDFMARMRRMNIGTALHYQAAHLFSYFGQNYRWKRGDFPGPSTLATGSFRCPFSPP
jgi:dTDP-4-amino-4,6-dideoxygalactose transaminase